MPAINFGPDDEQESKGYVVIVKLLLGVAAIAIVDWLVFQFGVEPTLPNIGLALAIHLAYFAVAYYVHPVADETDMGLAGGLIDDPFSRSDDVNRGLQTLYVVLIPGRLIVQSVVFFFRR